MSNGSSTLTCREWGGVMVSTCMLEAHVKREQNTDVSVKCLNMVPPRGWNINQIAWMKVAFVLHRVLHRRMQRLFPAVRTVPRMQIDSAGSRRSGCHRMRVEVLTCARGAYDNAFAPKNLSDYGVAMVKVQRRHDPGRAHPKRCLACSLRPARLLNAKHGFGQPEAAQLRWDGAFAVDLQCLRFVPVDKGGVGNSRRGHANRVFAASVDCREDAIIWRDLDATLDEVAPEQFHELGTARPHVDIVASCPVRDQAGKHAWLKTADLRCERCSANIHGASHGHAVGAQSPLRILLLIHFSTRWRWKASRRQRCAPTPRSHTRTCRGDLSCVCVHLENCSENCRESRRFFSTEIPTNM